MGVQFFLMPSIIVIYFTLQLQLNGDLIKCIMLKEFL